MAISSHVLFCQCEHPDVNTAHRKTRKHMPPHTHTDTHARRHAHAYDAHCFSLTRVGSKIVTVATTTVFTLFFVVLVRAIPTVSVIRASGEEVLPDFFVEADGSLRELARAAAARLAVVPSRCVLLSPAGDRMAHTQTPSDEKLVDGDVITVLVFAAPRVFAHRGGTAFAAVKGDGSVVTWENARRGVDSEKVKSELIGGVEHVVGNAHAFAEVKEDGSVVTWGCAEFEGNADSMKFELQGGVRHVVGGGHAFAAVKEDGSVVTWSDARYGGDSEKVKGELHG